MTYAPVLSMCVYLFHGIGRPLVPNTSDMSTNPAPAARPRAKVEKRDGDKVRKTYFMTLAKGAFSSLHFVYTYHKKASCQS